MNSDIKVRNITTTKVGEISRLLPHIGLNTLGVEVNLLFEKEQSVQGFPVIEEDKPVGLLMKHTFYYHLGKQYGYAIFMNRNIELLMDRTPLIVDYDTPLDRVSELAMKRNINTLYDYIIVTKDSKYHGIVSVRDLLQKTTEIQLESAKYANPLTGLPGNKLIEQKMSYVVSSRKEYSILYFDLDNFKPYNDVYGFDNGDKILEMTAEIIEQKINAFDFHDNFFGHIGGDDFVAIIDSYEIDKLCESIIEIFDKQILYFYTKKDRINGYILAENRHSVIEKFPIMSISIAVVNNKFISFNTTPQLAEYASKIKRKCKAYWKSIYIIGDEGE